MRTILKIIILLCALGLIWSLWNTLIKSGKQQLSEVEKFVNMTAYSTTTAPSEETAPNPQENQSETQEDEDSNFTYQPAIDKEESIDEVFIDGSAQHNYIDITGASKKQSNVNSPKKEDKRKYFLKESQKKQFIAFENEYRDKKMTKDELFSELMDAVYFDDIPKAMALINKGAPVDSPEKNTSFTPIFMAISNGSEDMLRMLIEQGASMDIYDDKGYAPIHRAVTGENYTSSAPYPANTMIQVLLEYGADINQGTQKEGTTPLMITAQEHKGSIMTFLIESGANEEITDNNQRTALDYAKSYDCTSCIRILLS